MKSKLISFGLICFMFATSCSKDYYYHPSLSLKINGSVVDSLTGAKLQNVVIWVSDESEKQVITFTQTNKLGEYYLDFKIDLADTLRKEIIHLSKSGYDLEYVVVSNSQSDISMTTKLKKSENDFLKPFILGVKRENDNVKNKTIVRIYFSEEVIIDERKFKDLAFVYFRRIKNACSYDAGNYTFKYDSYNEWIKESPTTISFIHQYEDIDYCTYSYYNGTTYSNNVSVLWSLYSIQFLKGLCHDSNGNYMDDYYDLLFLI
jgi:hypothetical protein